MKKTTKLIAAILFPLVGMMACTKVSERITSSDDIDLDETSITIDEKGMTNIMVNLKSNQGWTMEIVQMDKMNKENWLFPNEDIEAMGFGDTDLTFTCLPNTQSSSRTAIIRFHINSPYPEYASYTVKQTGTPVVSLEPITDMTYEYIVLSGKYKYEGASDFISKTGFIISKDGGDNEYVIVEPSNKLMNIKYPVTQGSQYKIKAFVETKNGTVFTSANEETLYIKFSVGTPYIDGELRTNTEIEGVNLFIPYFFGDGNNYKVSASCNIKGLSIQETDILLSPDGGLIELSISGMTTQTGAANFTVMGLPELPDGPLVVSSEVKLGGKGIVFYRETCGELTLTGLTKPINVSDKGTPANEPMVLTNGAEWLKEGQAQVEYYRSNNLVAMRYELERTHLNSKEDYAWSSGNPIMFLPPNKEGDFIIRHLDIPVNAKNIRMDFAIKNIPNPEVVLDLTPADPNIDGLKVMYSNNGGGTWIEIPWNVKDGYTVNAGHYYLGETEASIEPSSDLWVKFCINTSSNGNACRLDDIRIIGDFI